MEGTTNSLSLYLLLFLSIALTTTEQAIFFMYLFLFSWSLPARRASLKEFLSALLTAVSPGAKQLLAE